MANDSDNIVVAANGLVAIAPYGATLPTDATTALDAAFNELGYIDEEGAAFSPQLSVNEIMAWQSLSPVRTLLQSYSIEVSFRMLEWIEDNLVLAFGGGQFTDNLDGTWDFLLPAPGERLQYSVVIEGHDGSERYRVVLDKVELQNVDEISFNKQDASGFPVTLKALAGDTAGRPGAIYGSTV